MAQPAPGWCNPLLRKPPIKRFVARIRTGDDVGSRYTTQTSPCRCAAHPLLISGGEFEKGPI